MTWVILALLAALSWGFYGVTLHAGQIALKNPLRALLCVGVAYFLFGVVAPIIGLSSQGVGLTGFTLKGTALATAAGALGAIGAIFIIYAFRAGGLPIYVMPLVFGGAPLINVGAAMLIHPPKEMPNPLLWLGFILASSGVYLVLRFRPPI